MKFNKISSPARERGYTRIHVYIHAHTFAERARDCRCYTCIYTRAGLAYAEREWRERENAAGSVGGHHGDAASAPRDVTAPSIASAPACSLSLSRFVSLFLPRPPPVLIAPHAARRQQPRRESEREESAAHSASLISGATGKRGAEAQSSGARGKLRKCIKGKWEIKVAFLRAKGRSLSLSLSLSPEDV